MKSECLGQDDAKRGVVGTEFLPRRPLGPCLLEQALQHLGAT
jgi:hypothetical protein